MPRRGHPSPDAMTRSLRLAPHPVAPIPVAHPPAPAIDVALVAPDDLSPRQRLTLAVVVVAVHAAGLAALLGARTAPPAADGPAAIQVAWIAPEPMPRPAEPAAPPPQPVATPAPLPLAARRAPERPSDPPPAPPSPVPVDRAPTAAEPDPAATPVAATPAAAAASTVAATPATPAPAPAASPPPTLSIRTVAYLTPPQLTYPPASRRAQEEGRAQVRVRVDAAGAPRETVLVRGTGHARLDEAALATAAATRFVPYTENGVPRAFWVVMPFVFELEN